MLRRILLVLSLIASVACMAEEPVREKKKFLDTKFGRFLQKIDKWMDDGMTSGTDSSYIEAPELKSYCYLGAYTYWNNYSMHLPFNLPGEAKKSEGGNDNYSHYNINAHCTQVDAELGIDYKGLTLFLPITLSNHFETSFGLAKNGSVWGFRIRYKEMRNMIGRRTIHFSNPDAAARMSDFANMQQGESEFDWIKDKSLDPNDNIVRTFFAEGYYVLNSKRFSLSAGLFGEVIQKKSAGGPIIYASYYQTRYSADHILPADYDSFRTQQVSLGCGYGHNFPVRRGKLLFHLSAIPMFTLYTHQVHRARYQDEQRRQDLQKLYSDDDLPFYDAADNGRSQFRVNAFARFSTIYHINKRYLLTFMVNYRYYGYSNSKHLEINSQEADAQLNFCVRF